MAQRASSAALCRSCFRLERHRQVRSASAKRGLTCSAVRRGSGKLPVFHATQSEELSGLLEEIRSKIIIPAFLSRPQQKLVFQTKNHATLRNEPFSIWIGPEDSGESVPLEPIDRMRDIPPTWQSVKQAIRLMHTEGPSSSPSNARSEAADPDLEATEETSDRPRDQWANFVPLLDGIHTARSALRTWQWEYLIRFVGGKGATHALLSAAQQFERTGLYLFNARVAREIVWACRDKADLGGWTLESTTKALAFAEQFTHLMADSRQSAEAKKIINRTGKVDSPQPSQEPDIIGAVLELAARKAENVIASGASVEVIEDAKSAVTKYVARLTPNLEKIFFEQEYPCDTGKHSRRPPAAAADYQLLRWVPVLNGLQAAERVLGSGFADRDVVSRSTSHLERVVTQGIQTVMENVGGDEDGKRKGFIWAKQRASADGVL